MVAQGVEEPRIFQGCFEQNWHIGCESDY